LLTYNAHILSEDTMTRFLFIIPILIFQTVSVPVKAQTEAVQIPDAEGDTITYSRIEYENKLYGFWLAQSIANWTGLVTEMDKIGNIGEIKTGAFYTREDWGKPDRPSIWGEGVPSELSQTIEFVFADEDSIWGADDDTDIEYMYQYLMDQHQTPKLTANQIRDGWLTHIKPEEENYLWVSNQQAYDLMKQGMLPPLTGDPGFNPHYAMIDAQLTTEIFGLFAPGDPQRAIDISRLPIQTVARNEAEEIARFYVVMYSLSALVDPAQPMAEQTVKLAQKARTYLTDSLYPAKMFDFVYQQYLEGTPWEQTRDAIYERYQVEESDGYDITSQKLYCNGCFAAGINFASSLISWFYGEGDLKKTIKIGVLSGWDADNPTATWGGLLGFILGKDLIEEIFGCSFSNRFNIHRTRQNFPGNGIDTFEHMAETGYSVTKMVMSEH